MSDTSNTDELGALIARGELKAVQALLFQTHGPALLRFIRARVSDPAHAKDISGEVWRAVLEILPKLSDPSKARVWLLGIAHNKVRDLYRQPAFESLHSQLSAPAPLGALLGPGRPQTPVSAALEKERALALRAALRELSDHERDLLDLRFVEGLKPREIAEVIGGGVKPNTVSQRLVYAATKLRRKLIELSVFTSKAG